MNPLIKINFLTFILFSYKYLTEQIKPVDQATRMSSLWISKFFDMFDQDSYSLLSGFVKLWITNQTPWLVRWFFSQDIQDVL